MAAAILTSGYEYPKISIKASKYRLGEDGVEQLSGRRLDVVFVGANDRVSKVFYNKPYDPRTTRPRRTVFRWTASARTRVSGPVCESRRVSEQRVGKQGVNPAERSRKKCADQRHMAVVPAADPSKVTDLPCRYRHEGAARVLQSLANFGVNPEENGYAVGV